MIVILVLVAFFFLGFGSMLSCCANQAASNELAEQIVERPAVLTTSIPEDAVLRRHFIGQLRREVEAGLPPRPTDSILKRHHDAMVKTELNFKLAIIESSIDA
ncbi:hypothetical protein [Methylomonas sp. MgM2]